MNRPSCFRWEWQPLHLSPSSRSSLTMRRLPCWLLDNMHSGDYNPLLNAATYPLVDHRVIPENPLFVAWIGSLELIVTLYWTLGSSAAMYMGELGTLYGTA